MSWSPCKTMWSWSVTLHASIPARAVVTVASCLRRSGEHGGAVAVSRPKDNAEPSVSMAYGIRNVRQPVSITAGSPNVIDGWDGPTVLPSIEATDHDEALRSTW